MKTTAIFRPATLAVILGLGTVAAGTVYAQGPANQGPDRDGKRFERFTEHLKDRCERFEARLADMDKKLTTEQVRDIVAGRLAEMGNPNLKVGKASAKGEIVSVEIVTKDNSLVDVRELSTKTGLPPQAGQRCDKIEERIEKSKAEGRDGFRGRRGERGEGMGPGMGMGGLGLGLMGRGTDRDLNLTADQVKKLAEARLILQGNPRLKVGDVKEKDKDTYTVSIVTVDNSLVLARDVDKHTGHATRD
ncbi:MAG: hypothetical protein JNK21_09385 [Rhodospirillaceae bacterium]|nr:hypothetical protein [Rhodospirillaceae bacterium]